MTTAAPYTTTLFTVRDGIAQWFGGPYDQNSFSYRTPQVPNLGVVRRSRPKSEDDADYYIGQTASGALMGSVMYVNVQSGVESREAFAGAFGGLKLLRSTVALHVWMRSSASQSEVAEDAFYQLLDDVKTRIRADRGMGSGGWENGGFVVAEGGTTLRWQMRPPESSAELTSGYFVFNFSVDYYEEG